MLTALCLAALCLAAFPAMLFLRNLREYRPATRPQGDFSTPSVSVLIPARNEEISIRAAVEAALSNTEIDLEVIVLDDHSCDATAEIVRAIAAHDPRVKLHEAPHLPAGWCGKQHACHVLSTHATNPILVFSDADVRLAPDALLRMATFLDLSGADLASGFPRQETVGIFEQMVLPLMNFILLGFLPLRRMRAQNLIGMGAGCGQLFITKASSYESMGGHATIRATLHDGLKLPRAYRANGLKTDLFDATDAATCRMYRTVGDLWSGLAKNATEALAAPVLIGPATLILFGGQVLPILLMALSGTLGMSRWQTAIAATSVVFAYVPRFAGVVRFQQPLLGAILHPLGVLTLLSIQWYALVSELLGKPATWKGRTYLAVDSPSRKAPSDLPSLIQR